MYEFKQEFSVHFKSRSKNSRVVEFSLKVLLILVTEHRDFSIASVMIILQSTLAMTINELETPYCPGILTLLTKSELRNNDRNKILWVEQLER